MGAHMEERAAGFGDYLREMRKAAGLTLRQVEAIVGVSNAYLSQVETGKRPAPRPETIKKLAEAYRAPVEELLAQAGYLDSPSVMTKREVDRAFQYVIEDPKYKFGFKLRSQELTVGVKRFVVEMYQKATGKKLLPASVTRGDEKRE